MFIRRVLSKRNWLLVMALLLTYMTMSPLNPALANDGSTDNAFSGDGYVSFAQNWGAASTYSYGIATDSHNRVIAVGDIEATNSDPQRSFILRYLPSGVLDTSFSTDGKVAFSDNSWLDSVTVDSSDGIIAAGSDMSGNTHIYRFNVDGSLDSTFGVAGDVLLAENQIRNIKLDNNQRIIALRYVPLTDSFCISRFTVNGTLDTTFGSESDHLVPIPGLDSTSPNFRELELDTAQRILVGGSIEPIIQGDNPEELGAVFRYTANGILDTTFGAPHGYIKIIPDTQGLLTVADRLMSIHVQSNGRIVIVGLARYAAQRITDNDYNGVPFIAGFTSTGMKDTTFGTAGVTTIGSITSTTDTRLPLASVMNQAEQVVVISRATDVTSGYVSRFNRNGLADTTFGTNGKITWSPLETWAPSDIYYNEWWGNSADISESGEIYFTGTSNKAQDEYNGFISSFQTSVPRYMPGGAAIAYLKNAKITGTAKKGKTLTAVHGTWTDRLKTTYSYKWYSCTKKATTTSSSVPANCKIIPKAQKSKYAIGKKSTYVKKYLRVWITASNGIAHKSVLTPSSGPVK